MRTAALGLLAAAIAGTASAQSLVDRQQDQRCEAQLRVLSQPGRVAPDRETFLKTCKADVNPTAALPGPRLTIQAPAGATGICKDGRYTAAAKREGACAGHGGLARWIS